LFLLIFFSRKERICWGI